MKGICSAVAGAVMVVAMGAAARGQATRRAAVDLSEPKKAYASMMGALMAEDVEAVKRCIYAPGAEALLEASFADALAQHRAGKAVLEKFGEDGKRLLPGPLVFDEDIRKLVAAVESVPAEVTGDTVTLKSRPERRSGTEVPMRKVDGEWKIDRSRYGAMGGAALEKQMAVLKAHELLMREWGKRVAAGEYADVEAAKAGLGALEMAGKPRPEEVAAARGTAGTQAGTRRDAGALVMENRWSVKAKEAGPGVAKAAYGEMARLEDCQLTQMSVPGAPSIESPAEGTTDATVRLLKMGLEVVPVLAEALDDTTPTRTVPMSGQREEHAKPWPVNMVVGQMIRRLCGRDFAVGEGTGAHTLWDIGAHPELAEAFSKEIKAWVAANRKRTEVERKVADVNDGWFRNRLDAVEWLGREKAKAGREAIEAYIDRTLAAMEKQEDSLEEAELSECALALGQIGDKASLPKVRAACAKLSAAWEQRGGVTGSMDIFTLFLGYEGMAMLGEKEAALKELERIDKGYAGKLEASSVQEFEERLGKARGW